MTDVNPLDRDRSQVQHPRLAFVDLFEEMIGGLLGRPGRLVLTALGTVLGITALVSTLGLAKTAGNQIVSRFDELAETRIVLSPANTGFGGEQASSPIPWNAELRLARLNGVAAVGTKSDVDVAGALSRSVPVVDPLGINEHQIGVIATSGGLLDAVRGSIRTGRYFDNGHNERGDPVVVLGPAAAQRLNIFRLDTQPAIFIGEQSFTVLGIIEDVAREPDLLNAIVMPDATAKKFFGLAAPAEVHIDAEFGATQLIAGQAAFALVPDEPESLRTQASQGYTAVRQDVEGDVNALFVVLGAVSLLVGGLGIANVTLVSVLERTPEIGLRRGARRSPPPHRSPVPARVDRDRFAGRHCGRLAWRFGDRRRVSDSPVDAGARGMASFCRGRSGCGDRVDRRHVPGVEGRSHRAHRRPAQLVTRPDTGRFPTLWGVPHRCLVLLVFIAMVAVGCGSGSTSSDATATSSESASDTSAEEPEQTTAGASGESPAAGTGETPMAASSPIGAFFADGGGFEAALVEYRTRVEEKIVLCMAEQGFEFARGSNPVDEVGQAQNELSLREWTTQYGYGISTSYDSVASSRANDPNAEIVFALSAAEREQWIDTLTGGRGLGAIDDFTSVPLEEQGCIGEGIIATGGQEAIEGIERFGEAYEEGEAALFDRREMVEVVDTWSVCMSTAGFTGYAALDDPEEAIGAEFTTVVAPVQAAIAGLSEEEGQALFSGEAVEIADLPGLDLEALRELQAEEIQLAVADLDCYEREVKETYEPLRDDFENGLLTEFSAEVEALRNIGS